METPRILVIDDHPFFRSGIRHWLDQHPHLACCGEAGSTREARHAVAELMPDIVLLDVRLGDGDGLDLARELSGSQPELRIIILSQCDEAAYAHRALRAGARGYIMKSEATDVLETAIDAVRKGGLYLSRSMSARVLHNLFPDPVASDANLSRLSDRELQVFQLLGSGCSSRQIAESLKISPKTVDTYREHLKDKLNLADGSALVRAATVWVETGRLDLG